MSEKIIGVFGGGFKPPTKGHFEVVKDVLKKYPEITEFIVFIGGKMRDEISQAQSLIIWDIYKKYLPLKVKLETVNAPIGSIYSLAGKTEDKIYWVLGSRNEEDEKDIENRTHSLSKHDNITLIKWDNKSGEEVSGTKTRAALHNSKEEFFKFLPTELNDDEREEIYNLLAPQGNEYKSDPMEIKEWIKYLGLDLHEEIKGIVDEGKQVGNIYHFTDVDNIRSIIKSDELIRPRKGARRSVRNIERYRRGKEKMYDDYRSQFSMNEPTISVTRDKFLYKNNSLIATPLEVRISLDGDKLSHQYKIKPFNYFPGDNKHDPTTNEKEEVIISDKIKNLDSYVLAYDVLLEKAFLWHHSYESFDSQNLYAVDQIAKISNSKIRFLFKEKEVDLEKWLIERKIITGDSHQINVTEEAIREYHNKETLNPLIWNGEELKEELRESLLKIGSTFYKSLETVIPLQDIILVGSSANYNWTEASDIDLHLLMDFEGVKEEELVKKYFNAKKREFNEKYELEYEGHPIEVYVQDIKEPNAAQGVYSIINNKWLKVPEKENIDVSDNEINTKAQPLMDVIDKIEASPNVTPELINKVKQKIAQFRKSGLEKGGEYSLENLAFKLMRNNGYLEKLNDLQTEKVKDSFKLLKENPEDWYGTNNHPDGLYPSEFFDENHGTNISQKYQGEDKIDPDMLRDFIHKGLYEKEINTLYNEILQLNPELNNIKVRNSEDKFNMLYGVKSRLNIDDINYYINDRNQKIDDEIHTWERDNKLNDEIFWVLSPQTLEKLKQSLINENIDEGKQVGDVYHFTSLNSLNNIGKANKLQASELTSKRPYISTTRNKHFSLERRKAEEESFVSSDQVMIKLDGSKLSNIYKVKPHDDQWDLRNDKEEMTHPEYGDEMEEVWYGDKIKSDQGILNVKSYIKEIILNPSLDEWVDQFIRMYDFITKSTYHYGNNLDNIFGEKNQRKVVAVLDSMENRVIKKHKLYEIIIDNIESNFPNIPIKSQDKIGIREINDDNSSSYADTQTQSVAQYIAVSTVNTTPKQLYNDHKDEIQLIKQLVQKCFDDLKLKNKPNIELIDDFTFTQEQKSFACYIPRDNKIKVVIKGRNVADLLRSLSHEIYHSYQNENGLLDASSGEDGDDVENTANSYSGKIMREFGRAHPEIFTMKILTENVNESEKSIHFDNWVKPTEDVLKREFKVEHEMKGNDFWSSEKNFLKAVSKAKIVSLTKQQDSKINYRTRTETFDELHDLIKGYASYPKYRNKGTLKNLYQGFRKNLPMELPIIVDFGTHQRILAGNTRLDVAFQSGITPKVLLIQADND